MNGSEVFEREFLPMRAKVLELAAALDRIERAEPPPGPDPRSEQLRAGLELLLAPGDDRAEQVQLVFSREYDDDWQQQFGLSR